MILVVGHFIPPRTCFQGDLERAVMGCTNKPLRKCKHKHSVNVLGCELLWSKMKTETAHACKCEVVCTGFGFTMLVTLPHIGSVAVVCVCSFAVFFSCAFCCLGVQGAFSILVLIHMYSYLWLHIFSWVVFAFDDLLLFRLCTFVSRCIVTQLVRSRPKVTP